MRKLGGLALVASVAVAIAGGPPPAVTAQPSVRVIHVAGPGGSAGSISLANNSSTDVTITSLTRDPACASEVTAQLTTPAVIPANGQSTVTIQCAGTITSGMRRCVFHANPALGTDIVDFEGVCEGGTSATLTAAPTALDFGDVAVGASSLLPVTLTNSGASTIAKLVLQTTDLDGTFELAAPCNPDARECAGGIPGISTSGSTVVNVVCRPKSIGVHTATLRVASDTSSYLATPITLACTGTTPTGPVLALTGDPVDAGTVEVMMGSTTPRALHVRNVGIAPLTLSSVQIVDGGDGAAADWSYVASGACAGTIPTVCTLLPDEEVVLDLRFDPSVIGSRSATLVVSYSDGAARSRAVPLAGIGAGATLALVGPNVPLDFGVVPLNQTSQLTFTLANRGNRSTTAMLTATPSGAPFTLAPPATVPVPPDAPATVSISCRPTFVGDFATAISVTAADAMLAAPIDLAARCVGTTGPLYTTPTAIQLGELRVGTPVTSILLDALSTGASLQIVSATLATENPNLTVSSTLPASTPANLQVFADPLVPGTLVDDLVVTASNGATTRIPITGSVVTATYQEPLARSLGTFCVNQPTTADEIALVSTGTGTIGLEAPRLAAGALSPFDLELRVPNVYPTLLPPAGSTTVSITPKRSMTAGIQQDDVVWTTDVLGFEEARTSVSAEFVDDGGAIAPSALSFGPAVIHIDTVNRQRVTLQNCDTQTIMFEAPLVPPPFRIDSAGFPSQLAPNESATFSIGFHPTRKGVFSTDLVIRSSQLETDLVLHLDGEGVVDTLPPDAGVDPIPSDERSFYGCGGCASRDAGGSLMTVGVALVAILRRRRT